MKRKLQRIGKYRTVLFLLCLVPLALAERTGEEGSGRRSRQRTNIYDSIAILATGHTPP